jgi:hypothetical protein
MYLVMKIMIQDYMAHLHIVMKIKLLLTMVYLLAVKLMIIVHPGALKQKK